MQVSAYARTISKKRTLLALWQSDVNWGWKKRLRDEAVPQNYWKTTDLVKGRRSSTVTRKLCSAKSSLKIMFSKKYITAVFIYRTILFQTLVNNHLTKFATIFCLKSVKSNLKFQWVSVSTRHTTENDPFVHWNKLKCALRPVEVSTCLGKRTPGFPYNKKKNIVLELFPLQVNYDDIVWDLTFLLC